MSRPFLAEIITPEKLKFKGEVYGIKAHTPDGELGVLAHHAPLMALIVPCECVLKTEFRDMYFAVGEGFLQVRQNKAVLLVDFAERAEEIDFAEVLKEKEKLEKEINKGEKSTDADNLKIKLEQELARLRVAKRNV